MSAKPHMAKHINHVKLSVYNILHCHMYKVKTEIVWGGCLNLVPFYYHHHIDDS